ncbi:MAG: tRNA (guanosine(46)-N7)-methyltransferase TrmB [Burkholderiales bacterium]
MGSTRSHSHPEPDSQRPIRSYVLRQSRISSAQRRAVDALLPAFGVSYRPAQIDLDSIFGRSAPKVLEIGFGMGETTATIAAAQPEKDFLGVEVHTPGIGSLLKRLGELRLTNVRVIQHDAVEVVHDMIALASLHGIHVFFPDPWPKKRHHKRRLLQPQFVRQLALRLAPRGYLHVATDWQDYAEHILQVLGGEPQLENTARQFAPRPAYRPQTKFEARGLERGHGVWDLVFRRTTPTD